MGNVAKLAVLAAAMTLVPTPACAPAAEQTAVAGPAHCNKESLLTLYPEIFTFGTDEPVYPPWYIGDNPGQR